MRRITKVMRAIAISLIILFLSYTSEALEIRTTEAKGIIFVELSGEFVPNDASRFASTVVGVLEKHKGEARVLIVRLNSPGGLISEAMQISNLISKAKVPVAVSERDTCASACFLLFMNSPIKLLRHGARIGVHSASDGSGNESAKTTLTTVEMARLFKEGGVPNSVIGKMVTAPPGEMHYLSDSELMQMGARFVDDDNFAQAATGAVTPQAPTPPIQQPPPGISASVAPNPVQKQPPQPSAEELTEAKRREELRAEQDRNFAKYWNQILGWSKAQHSGLVASERRCNQTGCAKVVAYFDRQQRYVEAWNYELPPKGSGAKIVCRQMQVDDKLACADWYDGHEFVIDYTHQIGADRVSGGDLLDIFR